MNKKTMKLKVSSIGDMTIQLLTIPVNPEAPKEEQVRRTNAQIATLVTKAFPQRKSSDSGAISCVAWYASQLRGDAKYREKHGGKEPLPTSNDKVTREITIEDEA